MKLLAVLLLMAIAGCASNRSEVEAKMIQEISGDAFELADARIEQCRRLFSDAAKSYQTMPITLTDLEDLAKRIKPDSTLGASLDLGPSHKYQNLQEILRDRDAVLQLLRTNADRFSSKPECSAVADEYLEDALFSGAVKGGSLKTTYESLDNAKIGYRKFLLLALVFYVNNKKLN